MRQDTVALFLCGLTAVSTMACSSKEEPQVQKSTQAESVCDDGIDNDGNGLTDCADPACRQSPACISRADSGPIPVKPPPPLVITDAGSDGGGDAGRKCTPAPLITFNNPDFEDAPNPMSTSTPGPFNGWQLEFCGDNGQVAISPHVGATPPQAAGQQQLLLGNNCFVKQEIPSPAPGTWRLTFAFTGAPQGRFGTRGFHVIPGSNETKCGAGVAQNGKWDTCVVETTIAGGAASLLVQVGQGGFPGTKVDNFCVEKL